MLIKYVVFRDIECTPRRSLSSYGRRSGMQQGGREGGGHVTPFPSPPAFLWERRGGVGRAVLFGPGEEKETQFVKERGGGGLGLGGRERKRRGEERREEETRDARVLLGTFTFALFSSEYAPQTAVVRCSGPAL